MSRSAKSPPPCDVFVSLKFTGPSYMKGSTKQVGVFVDRVITAR